MAQDWTPGYPDLLPGQPIVVYYDEDDGWPATRPVSRTDVPIFCVDHTGEAPNPAWVVLGRDIILVAEIEEVPGVTPLATYTFEDQTNGQPLSLTPASRPWYTQGGATVMTAATAAAAHGTLGGRITSATSYRYLGYFETALTTDTRVYDAYFNIREMGAAVAYLMAVRGDDDGIHVRADVRINTNLTVSIRNGNSAVATSATALALNTTYRFAYKVVSGQTQELRVYAGEATTPLFVLTGAVTGTALIVGWFGTTTTSTGLSVDVDTARVAEDWLAPYA